MDETIKAYFNQTRAEKDDDPNYQPRRRRKNIPPRCIGHLPPYPGVPPAGNITGTWDTVGTFEETNFLSIMHLTQRGPYVTGMGYLVLDPSFRITVLAGYVSGNTIKLVIGFTGDSQIQTGTIDFESSPMTMSGTWQHVCGGVSGTFTGTKRII
jgi:hypothetical protein